jgi:hypothetical protein
MRRASDLAITAIAPGWALSKVKTLATAATIVRVLLPVAGLLGIAWLQAGLINLIIGALLPRRDNAFGYSFAQFGASVGALIGLLMSIGAAIAMHALYQRNGGFPRTPAAGVGRAAAVSGLMLAALSAAVIVGARAVLVLGFAAPLLFYPAVSRRVPDTSLAAAPRRAAPDSRRRVCARIGGQLARLARQRFCRAGRRSCCRDFGLVRCGSDSHGGPASGAAGR